MVISTLENNKAGKWDKGWKGGVRRRCVLISSEMVTEKVTVGQHPKKWGSLFWEKSPTGMEGSKAKSRGYAWVCEEKQGGQVTRTE